MRRYRGSSGRLRVDLYAEDGTWLESRSLSRRTPSDFPASFSVFSADWMKVPEAEIPRSHALMTVIGGEIVWQAE